MIDDDREVLIYYDYEVNIDHYFRDECGSESC
jgi:hypothetical protein